jgi:hypothetical protein
MYISLQSHDAWLSGTHVAVSCPRSLHNIQHLIRAFWRLMHITAQTSEYEFNGLNSLHSRPHVLALDCLQGQFSPVSEVAQCQVDTQQ